MTVYVGGRRGCPKWEDKIDKQKNYTDLCLILHRRSNSPRQLGPPPARGSPGGLLMSIEQVLMFTQRVMSEYTIWFFVFLIVTATWAIMSLMIAAMLARFKAVSLAENLRLKEERVKVGWLVC